MKKRWYCLILPILTLILEILPYGAVLNFMLPSADGTSVGHFREFYSYFDLTPFGYANFAPLITAVLSCIVLVFVGIFSLTGQRKWAIAARDVLCIAVVVSLCPLLLGIRYFSVVGLLISLSLGAEIFMIQAWIKSSGISENLRREED